MGFILFISGVMSLFGSNNLFINTIFVIDGTHENPTDTFSHVFCMLQKYLKEVKQTHFGI